MHTCIHVHIYICCTWIDLALCAYIFVSPDRGIAECLLSAIDWTSLHALRPSRSPDPDVALYVGKNERSGAVESSGLEIVGGASRGAIWCVKTRDSRLLRRTRVMLHIHAVRTAVLGSAELWKGASAHPARESNAVLRGARLPSSYARLGQFIVSRVQGFTAIASETCRSYHECEYI